MLGLDIPSANMDKENSSDDDHYKKPIMKVNHDDFDRIKIISQGACKYKK